MNHISRLSVLRSLAAAILLIVGSAATTRASLVTFNLAWSGEELGNRATATGQITIDTAAIPNPGSYYDAGNIPTWASGITVTITGASSGNGTFTMADFGGIYWDTATATLDLGTQLVGQPTPGGPWASNHDGPGGDFNLFSNFSNPTAPNGTYYFQLTTNGGAGDTMNLIGFTPVPEPATIASACIAVVAGLLVARRRRPQA